ncbi:CDP-glycerol glycerophosphotransferase family protein [Paenibacillus sp. NPDC058174]|uniref:CDP-glycerol glycerophosphotransferase family protein n=1 Tax=Paenibacillus sp. NPDC058174 TaxID=3346366 RepID=UPI0036DD4942
MVLEKINKLISNNEIEAAYELIIENEKQFEDNAEYWGLYGVLCLLIKEYRSAVTCLQKAHLINPNDSDINYNYGYALEALNQHSDAAIHYGIAYRNADDMQLKAELENLYVDNPTLKKIFIAAGGSEKLKFIMLSSNGWNNEYQRMHHIARALSNMGHEVHYVCPPLAINSYEESVTLEKLNEISEQYKKVIDGVNIYQPLHINSKPVMSNILSLTQLLVNEQSNRNEPILITYLPSHYHIIDKLKGEFYHIYDCVDDHSDLKYAFWGKSSDYYYEQLLMDKANAITTTATSLYLQRTVIENRKNVWMSKNAVHQADFLFAEEPIIPFDLAEIPEPRVIFTGVVYQRFDEELFYGIVSSNPDLSFIIVGAVLDGQLTKSYPNLYLLGSKKHVELKDYLYHCDIGIVPYTNESSMNIACDSIKQYEYIASGLPVITTYMPESFLDKINVRLAQDVESFNQAIELCLNSKGERSEVEQFLIDNSWNERAATLVLIANRQLQHHPVQELDKVGQSLYQLSTSFSDPVFDLLYGLYLHTKDKHEFLRYARQAYEQKPIDYVEQKYLEALLIHNNMNDFLGVLESSVRIDDIIKEEFLFHLNNNSVQLALAIAHLVVRDVQGCMGLLNMESNEWNSLYTLYISSTFGEQVTRKELNELPDTVRLSPIYQYMMSTIQDTFSGMTWYLVHMSDLNVQTVINEMESYNVPIEGVCSSFELKAKNKDVVSIRRAIELQSTQAIRLLVPFNDLYKQQIQLLAENGVTECDVCVYQAGRPQIVHIDQILMQSIRNREYEHTIIFNLYHSADSNVYALLQNVPEGYQDKYNIQVIHGQDVWSIEQVVKVPLQANVTVSGFNTFLYNPKFTVNVEVWHAGIPLKACGIMDKKDKSSGGTPEIFKKVDFVCTASHMNMIVFSSFYSVPEDKYRITGLPRNDKLLAKDGKAKRNLERLLGIDLSGKKIIFNMPTFHVFDSIQRVEGNSQLTDSVKIIDFDYTVFNEFLKQNQIVCISKSHHAEQLSVAEHTQLREYDHLFFLNNDNLGQHGLDLYEVLEAGDLLITDYSSVYNDFLFMNKPTVFVPTDIEEYRLERGLALEPYDFWTAGPKAYSQEELQSEILKSLSDSEYYQAERDRLRPVFFKYTDNQAVERTWNVIDEAFQVALKKERLGW